MQERLTHSGGGRSEPPSSGAIIPLTSEDLYQFTTQKTLHYISGTSYIDMADLANDDDEAKSFIPLMDGYGKQLDYIL